MKYYLIGIKGAGMSALALLFDDLGYNVVGYDDAKDHRFTEDNLLERNIKNLHTFFIILRATHFMSFWGVA